MKPTIITRAVWILSLVSLFTDISSEMLYPIMPVYLKSIGFSIVLIGVLEGFAEAIAGFSKGYFGKLSDVQGKRLPFVQLGYLLSALSKPMMAVFTYPVWIFSARSLDRLGKGIRTGARDALLSDEATPETKGRVFGFHRGMDTVGAVIGPTLALLYLYYYPGHYAALFFIAFAPGLLGVITTYLLKEKKHLKPKVNARTSFFSFFGYWRESEPQYRQVAGALLFFALLNSSDVFLLLMMKNEGLSDTHVIAVYIFYNLVYALSSYPIGIIADKMGLKNMLIIGLLLFAVVYGGMALASTTLVFYALFFLYGIYAASTEGIAKALISNSCHKSDTATAIGTFSAFGSIAALLASALAGLLWFYLGPAVMFSVSAIGCLAVVVYLKATNLKTKVIV
jgi:MFS family permease